MADDEIETMVELRDRIGTLLDKMRENFADEVKLTLLVRRPEIREGDVFVSDDDPDHALAAIRYLLDAGKEIPGSAPRLHS